MGNIYCKEFVSESILYIVKGKIVKFSYSKLVYWLLIKRIVYFKLKFVNSIIFLCWFVFVCD